VESSDDEDLEEKIREEEAKLLCEDLLDEDEEMDDDEIQDMLGQNMKFNIIFTVGRPEEEAETSEDEEEEVNKLQFKKNQKVSVQYKDWEKEYMGKITSVISICNNPDYSLYNIDIIDNELPEGEEWAIQENIKGKYITAVIQKEIVP
jgi:hypothetical protein